MMSAQLHPQTGGKALGAILESMVDRLTWQSSDHLWGTLPPWWHDLSLNRDPRDNAFNFKVVFEGMARQRCAVDQRQEALAWIAFLRTTEVPMNSLAYSELDGLLERLDDPPLQALIHAMHLRAHIFHRQAPAATLERMEVFVSSASAVRDRYIDKQVGDLIGTYASLVGAQEVARKAFMFGFRYATPGTSYWEMKHHKLATVAIMQGDLRRARACLRIAEDHAVGREPSRNIARWIESLSAESIQFLAGQGLTADSALEVRQRAMRRFLQADMIGVASLEACIEDILAGVPGDSVTGLVSPGSMRERIDETVALGRPCQLAIVHLPYLLAATSTLEPRVARAVNMSMRAHFVDAIQTGVGLAKVDDDRYAIFSELDQKNFNAVLDELLTSIRQPVYVDGHNTALHFQTNVSTTSAVSGDTGFSIWERVIQASRNARPGSLEVVAPTIEREALRFALVQALLAENAEQYCRTAFQPIVNISTRRIHGFECLLRWECPEFGAIPPALVIEVAEQCGAIDGLERHIVTQAIAGAAELLAVDPECTVNVNLSAAQLTDVSIVRHLQSEVERFSVSPASIRIELTESALIDGAAADEALALFGASGFRMVLDDFGTGYSNLAYLLDLPAAGLKIDGSFVRSLLTEPRALAICRMLIQAGEALGFPIVAEHVATIEQAERLRDLGCDLHQGYLYAPAVRLQTAREMILDDQTLPWTWPAMNTAPPA